MLGDVNADQRQQAGRHQQVQAKGKQHQGQQIAHYHAPHPEGALKTAGDDHLHGLLGVGGGMGGDELGHHHDQIEDKRRQQQTMDEPFPINITQLEQGQHRKHGPAGQEGVHQHVQGQCRALPEIPSFGLGKQKCGVDGRNHCEDGPAPHRNGGQLVPAEKLRGTPKGQQTAVGRDGIPSAHQPGAPLRPQQHIGEAGGLVEILYQQRAGEPQKDQRQRQP